jgi:hypothetical protein
MGIRVLVLLLAAIVCAAVACSSDPVRPAYEDGRQSGPSGGSGGGGATLSDAGGRIASDAGDAGACTDLANTGLVVDETAVNTDFVGVGGSIVDGTYNIVEVRLYVGASGTPGPTNRTHQGSIRVTGSTYESVIVARTAGGPAPEVRNQGTLSPNGTNAATLELTCPTTSQEQLTYSAATNTLTIFNSGTKLAFTMTKRP